MLSELTGFVRQDFLAAASYKVRMAFSVGGLVFTIVPVYFIANAIQPVMEDSIRDQGGQYFGFLVVGLAIQRLLWAAGTSLPQTMNAGIRTGTLEALFITPVRLPFIVTGLMSYRLLWAFVEVGLLLAAAAIAGADFVPRQIPTAAMIVLLIGVTHIAFGLIGGATLLAFRATGPLVGLVTLGSVLLGGVYYPTKVIPSWLQDFSAFIPLTYGLRALRRTLLEGLPFSAVAGDLGILVAFAVGLIAVSALLFHHAFGYARRSGSLAQY
jgi:ABC-type multidrug transport system permease subunit